LARSREQAVDLVAAGRVTVAGRTADKAATQVESAAAIVVADLPGGPAYVSRGAHKLLGALDAFIPAGLIVAGRRCLDAGASTGGFTDVLLRAGAEQVIAVDVGYGQLAWALRTDERVSVLDRCNVRELTAPAVGGPVDLLVADLSFISLTVVLPALVALTHPTGDLVLMVKPQFEVGRERLGHGGVVREPALRAEVVLAVARAAHRLGRGTRGVHASPLPGPSGNVEYFLWLRAGAPGPDPGAVDAAIAAGPR
jgi:23S rRNA (cytidine1920-2'-O)/16S rRNA (cytidine1409-2'-O)-methyltransferase